MKKIMIAAVALLAFVSIQTCDLVDSGNQGIAYPTTIKPLQASQLDTLKMRFGEQNGSQVCYEMDKYGFLSFPHCSGRPVLRAVVSDDSQAIVSKAKRMLLANREFTGVADTSSLVIIRLNEMQGCILCDGSPGDIRTIKMGVDFANQIYRGLEVLNSQYTVVLDSSGVVEVVGHWFEEIAVPPTDKWSADKSKQSLTGKSIVWYGFGGEQHTFIVSAEDLLDPARRVIVQHQVGGNIELRVAWEIPVGKGFLMWNIYLDSTTGDELGTTQLFVT